MSVFTFEKSSFLGNVVSVDTSKIWLSVDSEKMRHARVGRLVALKAPGLENWLIAIVERIVKTSFETEIEEELSDIKEDLTETEFASDADDFISEDNKVKVALLGAVKTEPEDKIDSFSRSIIFRLKKVLHYLEGKKMALFDFGVTACKTTQKWQKEGHFTTPVPVDPNISEWATLFAANIDKQY